jgi:FimV-like protein
MNGSSYLFDGESTAKALASLEAAHRMLPSNARINLLLAKAYIADENDMAARPLLQSVVAWEDQSTADAAQTLLDQLDKPAAVDARPVAKSPAE